MATLVATQPRIVLDGARAQAAAADTYRQLSLFGDVFERVRSSRDQRDRSWPRMKCARLWKASGQS